MMSEYRCSDELVDNKNLYFMAEMYLFWKLKRILAMYRMLGILKSMTSHLRNVAG